jgi:hypothetical protein
MLKPRAAAVVLMDKRQHRQLAVLAVMHCSMCLLPVEPASAVALAVKAVKQVLSLRLLAWSPQQVQEEVVVVAERQRLSATE